MLIFRGKKKRKIINMLFLQQTICFAQHQLLTCSHICTGWLKTLLLIPFGKIIVQIQKRKVFFILKMQPTVRKSITSNAENCSPSLWCKHRVAYGNLQRAQRWQSGASSASMLRDRCSTLYLELRCWPVIG